MEYVDGRLVLEEVKGKVFNMINFSRKNLAALAWCQRRGITFRLVFWHDLHSVPS